MWFAALCRPYTCCVLLAEVAEKCHGMCAKDVDNVISRTRRDLRYERKRSRKHTSFAAVIESSATTAEQKQ